VEETAREGHACLEGLSLGRRNDITGALPLLVEADLLFLP
jgi:hypothetical protein